MNIVIDTNILFSALIKDSETRKLILNYNSFFLFPSYIFDEMKEHILELYEKSNMTKKEFRQLLKFILKKVIIVKNETILPFKKEAFDIMKDIDIDDSIFIACALVYSDSIIWSNDKNLKKQNKVKVLSTREIKEKIENQKFE